MAQPNSLYRAAPQQARVLIMEEVVPGPETPHFSKLFDIHMIIMSTGQERTVVELIIRTSLGIPRDLDTTSTYP